MASFLPYHTSRGLAVLNVGHLLIICYVNRYHLQKCVFSVDLSPRVDEESGWMRLLFCSLRFSSVTSTFQISQEEWPTEVLSTPPTYKLKSNSKREGDRGGLLPLACSQSCSSFLFIELSRLDFCLWFTGLFPCSWNGNLALCSYSHPLFHLSLLNSPSGIPASLLPPLLLNLHVLVDFLSSSSDLITPLPCLKTLHRSPLLLIKLQTLPTGLLTLCWVHSEMCDSLHSPLPLPIHQAGRQDPTRRLETRSRERM